jgi:hypothetical protein
VTRCYRQHFAQVAQAVDLIKHGPSVREVIEKGLGIIHQASGLGKLTVEVLYGIQRSAKEGLANSAHP